VIAVALLSIRCVLIGRLRLRPLIEAPQVVIVVVTEEALIGELRVLLLCLRDRRTRWAVAGNRRCGGRQRQSGGGRNGANSGPDALSSVWRGAV
jgi:hypothetical protein